MRRHSRRMKLLLVINSMILAGAEVFFAELAPLLKQAGIDVSVLLLRRLDGALEKILAEQGIPVLYTPQDRIYAASQIWHLRKRFREFDIVHTQLFPTQLWSVLGRSGRQPVLLTTEQNTDNNRRKAWLRPMDRFMYSRYDHICSNSEATRTRLEQWLPELQVEMSVIPNGISLNRVAHAKPLSRRTVVGDDDRLPILLSAARLQPQKDHATLLRAIAMLGQPVHLLLAGDGELKPELERLAADLGIRERVHFLGRRDDVPSLLRTADIFVHSTHSDGFCVAALEAMAAGLPLVASRVPGLAEVIGNAGLLVPPQDPKAFAAAVSLLLAQPERRHELAQAARQRSQLFSIEASAKAYID